MPSHFGYMRGTLRLYYYLNIVNINILGLDFFSKNYILHLLNQTSHLGKKLLEMLTKE